MKKLSQSRVSHTLSAKTLATACAMSIAVALTGCSSNNSAGTSMTGSVTAPGGAIAFNQPTGFKKMLAEIFGGKLAHAAITGVSAVGAGVTIELIEVDASGVKVGSTLASTTTDANGAYSLTPPAGFVPAAKYVIRATGTTQTLDVRVTSTTTNNVDPVTDAASDIVTAQFSDLTKISADEITIINEAVESIAKDIDPTSLNAETLSTALQTEATNNEEVINQITSTAAVGQVCGNVKDASATNLANILIVVRDFGNWVTRAKIKTDSSGNYCVNVPDGDYIVGALNFTGTSTAASEWWHTSGTKYSQIDAEKVTVAANKVTKDFALEAGARISGTVTAGAGGTLASGTALESVKVLLRNYQNFFPVAGKKTKADGTYRINVIPGTYQVGATNRTLNAYASEYYTATGGTNTYYTADAVTLVAGDKKTINFSLDKGYKLSGTILDNTGGNAVAGMRIRVNVSGSGPAQRLRTNKQGKYRIWLKPGTYAVESYGQSNSSLDMTASNQTYSPIGPVTAIKTNVKYSGTGVSQAKVWLLDNAGTTTISQEVSSGDGSITLYCKTGVNCAVNTKAYVRIDESRSYGSSVYSGKTDLTNATLVDSTQTTLSDITLPAGGTLKVTVKDGTTVQKAFNTRVLSGGNTFINSQRTHGDGTYLLSLPAGTFVVKMLGDADKTNCSVTITAGGTTNLSYGVTSNTCTAS